MNPDRKSTDNNLKIAANAIFQAKKQGADIALLPEMWNIGYDVMFPGYNSSNPYLTPIYQWTNKATPVTGEYVSYFQNLAKELDIAIGLTYMEEWEDSDAPPRNSMTLIDRFGNILYTYAKIHTCNWVQTEALTTPGRSLYTATLNTKNGPIEVGTMICYDREHFESARILSVINGAELILVPNACILSTAQLRQLQTRSIENVAAIAMTNYVNAPNNGNSVIYDHLGRELLLGSDTEEGVFVASIDIGELRRYRSTPAGYALRHPPSAEQLCNLQRISAFQAPSAYDRASGSSV